MNTGGIIISLSQQVTISSSLFILNTAQNGGAILFTNINQLVQFKSCSFYHNTAFSSGGALYFEDIGTCLINFDIQTKVYENKALIGGGLRITSSISGNLNIPLKFPFYENVYNNTATIYGDDSTTYLQSIVVQKYDFQQQKSEYIFEFYNNQSDLPKDYKQYYSKYVKINNFQSGSNLYLRVYIVDNYNRYLSFSLQNLINGSYPSDVETELKSIQILFDNINTKYSQLIGEKILNYNQYNSTSLGYEITSLQVQGALQTAQVFSISSNIYSQSQIQLPVMMEVQFRECQIGEIIQDLTNQISICKFCQTGTYSLVDPQYLYQQSQNSQENYIKNQCYPCPVSALSCQGSVIQLKNGYWRSSETTDEILECDTNNNSCQAENPLNKNGCVEGYMGPLCEQCDIIGEVWNGKRYTKSIQQKQCEICASRLIQYFYILLKGVLLGAYFIFTMKVFVDQFIFSQRCYYLRIIKLIPISKNSIKDYSGFYIKILITYFQLSQLLIQQPQNSKNSHLCFN
ncbi:transmembrane protein, putative (macronuclear) [Tetrahymena thermophila SB210]|uniref:Transmembrane protein, putative n=1 Tax=Tetrahymena thermophila (strain SB210) TaxID=312017 RepID=I7MCH9_TETTS|nr:transmembrane protein, putative [Tetrahymena thermophila SB210]EAR83978.2 transmembrane protein, putative [Tetrahymena thermophila SB210]|eukprot:XP_001031641.2 transmembrane protein, putative [Tetrahymena thermophila SB210]